MSSINMQQTQALSVATQQQQQQMGGHQALNAANSNALSNFNPQSDFSLDFLENLPAADSSALTEQELLNSFDADPGFNLQDIL